MTIRDPVDDYYDYDYGLGGAEEIVIKDGDSDGGYDIDAKR